MAISTQTNGAADIAADFKTLQAERDQLRAELDKVKSERDSYLKSLYYFMRKEAPPPDFTKEELLACVDNEPPLEDVIAELEREMRSGA